MIYLQITRIIQQNRIHALRLIHGVLSNAFIQRHIREILKLAVKHTAIDIFLYDWPFRVDDVDLSGASIKEFCVSMFGMNIGVADVTRHQLPEYLSWLTGKADSQALRNFYDPSCKPAIGKLK